MGRELAIELSQAPRRRVAWIREDLLTGFGAREVHPLEVRFEHHDFAAHLDPTGQVLLQSKGDSAHRLRVVGHLLARRPVPARRADLQKAVHVGQGDRRAVELQFAEVINRFRVESLSHALVEEAKLLLPEGIVEREHRQGVAVGIERRDGRGADALGRAIGRTEFGMRRLQIDQLPEKGVVLAVRDLGRIVLVIPFVVVVDLAAEAFGKRGRGP